jgi:hypothetical protein
MGLVLYAILILFGARGMPLRRAIWFCLLTAVLLTTLGLGAIDSDIAQGRTFETFATLALVFPMTLAVALLSFGCGVAAKKLLARVNG